MRFWSDQRVRSSVVSAMILTAVTGCAAPVPHDSPEIEPVKVSEVQETVLVDPDFRTIDRGIQNGLSKSAGWPENEFAVAEAFLEPWPSDFSRKELIDSAMARTLEYVNKQAETENARKITVHFEPDFPESQRAWIEELAAESMKIFGADIYPGGVHLVVGDSRYLVEILEEEKPAEFVAEFCGNDEAPEGDIFFCAGSDIAMVRFGRTVDNGALENDGSWTSVVAHEVFHTFQHFQSEKISQQQGLPSPVWMDEGSAEFFGFALAELTGVSSYYVSPWSWRFYLPDPELGLKTFGARPPFPYPPEEYWMGQMATEYIVASVGLDVLLDIYREYGSSGGNFEAAFETATGLPLAEFYERFDAAYRNLFAKNTELVDYRNRECPSWWGECEVLRGQPAFIEEVKRVAGDDGCIDFVEAWWTCVDSPVELPEISENGGHDLQLSFYRIPNGLLCADFQRYTGGWAESGLVPTFELADKFGVDGMAVSTEWYAKWVNLDKNGDGVICSSAVPESS